MLRQSPPVPKALCNRWQFRESGFMRMLVAHRGTCDSPLWQVVFYGITSETVKPEFQVGVFDVTTVSHHFFLQSCVAWKPKLPIGTSLLTILKWIFNVYIFLFFYFLRLSPSNVNVGLSAHRSWRSRPEIAPEKSFRWKVAMAKSVVVRSGMEPGSIDMHVYVHLYILIIHQHCHHQMLKSTLARQLQ